MEMEESDGELYFTTDEENEWEEEEEEQDDEDHVLGVRVDQHRPLVPLDVEDEEEFPPLPAPLPEGDEGGEEEEGEHDGPAPPPAAEVHVKQEKAEQAEGEVIDVAELADGDNQFVYLDEDEENVLCWCAWTPLPVASLSLPP